MIREVDTLLLVHDADRDSGGQAAGQEKEVAQGVVEPAAGCSEDGDARSAPLQGQFQGQFQISGVFFGRMQVHLHPLIAVLREQIPGNGVHVSNRKMRKDLHGRKMPAASVHSDQAFGGGDHGPDFGRKFKGAVGQENPVHHFSAV